MLSIRTAVAHFRISRDYSKIPQISDSTHAELVGGARGSDYSGNKFGRGLKAFDEKILKHSLAEKFLKNYLAEKFLKTYLDLSCGELEDGFL